MAVGTGLPWISAQQPKSGRENVCLVGRGKVWFLPLADTPATGDVGQWQALVERIQHYSEDADGIGCSSPRMASADRAKSRVGVVAAS
ncbi:hypothetical protein RCH23_000605 [Cryobacterium sp. CAN_C3]|nr:hypothetical protein [Cryobacterium sp. CAN_C3]